MTPEQAAAWAIGYTADENNPEFVRRAAALVEYVDSLTNHEREVFFALAANIAKRRIN